jgi:AbrB family looped-hinge helix DNA binding protein
VNTVISTKGQIVLPAELRKRDGVAPGQVFEVVRLGRGDYRIVRRKRGAGEGLVGWLRSCPEKGWFIPVESESTDSL